MPGVDRNVEHQTRYEGQDGYALVDRSSYEAMEARCRNWESLNNDLREEIAGHIRLTVELRAECERLRRALREIKMSAETATTPEMLRYNGAWVLADAALREGGRT